MITLVLIVIIKVRMYTSLLRFKLLQGNFNYKANNSDVEVY